MRVCMCVCLQLEEVDGCGGKAIHTGPCLDVVSEPSRQGPPQA